MRIAVSGSHCTGKSTLIDAFLRAHPEFIHEPEPYELMGDDFSAEPNVEDFLRQLEFNIERLKQHEPGTKVIYERCPLDFLAYIQCLSKATLNVDQALQHLDLIVYLPIDHTIEPPDDEFPKLRKAVDRRLSEIYEETDVTVIEASGPTEKRLRLLEAAINAP
jgi:predicted ATPase